MKCPLLSITRPGLMQPEAHPQNDCLKEECAWWDKHCQTCSVYEISRSLMGIFDIGVEIKDRMPYEGQLRK